MFKTMLKIVLNHADVGNASLVTFEKQLFSRLVRN